MFDFSRKMFRAHEKVNRKQNVAVYELFNTNFAWARALKITCFYKLFISWYTTPLRTWNCMALETVPNTSASTP